MERIVFDLIGNLNKHDDSNEKGQKAIGLDIKQKNNFEGALCFFYTSLPLLNNHDVKLPNFMFCWAHEDKTMVL